MSAPIREVFYVGEDIFSQADSQRYTAASRLLVASAVHYWQLLKLTQKNLFRNFCFVFFNPRWPIVMSWRCCRVTDFPFVVTNNWIFCTEPSLSSSRSGCSRFSLTISVSCQSSTTTQVASITSMFFESIFWQFLYSSRQGLLNKDHYDDDF